MLRFLTTKKRRPPVEALAPQTLTAGKTLCPYGCLCYFSPQGLPAHVRSHEARGDRKVKQAKIDNSGKVKLRTKDKDGNWTTLSTTESDELRKNERNGSLDCEDEEITDANGPTTAPTEPSGKTPEDERGEDRNGVGEDAIDLTRETPEDESGEDENGVEEDEEEEEEAPVIKGRNRNLRVSEKVAILDEWNEKKGTMGKKAFCRLITAQYKRPFEPKQLRRLLDDEEKIRESGRKKGADRRYQSNHREKSGKYPDMEWSLAAWIRGMRDMGIVVETWMVNAEARTLLHLHYPKEFPEPPNDDETDHDSFPFKCSDTWRKGFYKRFGFSMQ